MSYTSIKNSLRIRLFSLRVSIRHMLPSVSSVIINRHIVLVEHSLRMFLRFLFRRYDPHIQS